MRREDQIALLTALFDHSRDALLAKIDRIPEDWDGHEIRAWVTLDVARNIGGFSVVPVQSELKDLRKPRVKAFRNTLLTRNL